MTPEPQPAQGPEADEDAALAGPAGQDGGPETASVRGEPGRVAEIAAAVRDLTASTERYHDRARQREGVIDHLRSELEVLRRGERRGLLRPLLADMCRLRNDLLRQACELPSDYDAKRAAELLISYAESIQITLEGNGVVTYAPDAGEAFNPRMHRRVKAEETADSELSGRIAHVRRDGYLDIESNSPVAPAEVTVFTITKGQQ